MSIKNTNLPAPASAVQVNINSLISAIDQATDASTELAKGTVAARRESLLQKALTNDVSAEERQELAGLLIGVDPGAGQLVKSLVADATEFQSTVDASPVLGELFKGFQAVLGEIDARMSKSVVSADSALQKNTAALIAVGDLLKAQNERIETLEKSLEAVPTAINALATPQARMSLATAGAPVQVLNPPVARAESDQLGADRANIVEEYRKALEANPQARVSGGRTLRSLGLDIDAGVVSDTHVTEIKRLAQSN